MYRKNVQCEPVTIALYWRPYWSYHVFEHNAKHAPATRLFTVAASFGRHYRSVAAPVSMAMVYD